MMSLQGKVTPFGAIFRRKTASRGWSGNRSCAVAVPLAVAPLHSTEPYFVAIWAKTLRKAEKGEMHEHSEIHQPRIQLHKMAGYECAQLHFDDRCGFDGLAVLEPEGAALETALLAPAQYPPCGRRTHENIRGKRSDR